MLTVKFGSVRTDDPKCKLLDTILPIQSFLINVGRSIDALSTPSSILEFLSFDPTFGNSGFADTYSPWGGLDYFDRAKILSTLKPASVKRRPEPRRLQFKGLQCRSATKSLPPSSSKTLTVKRQSDSELPSSSVTKDI